VLLLAGLAAGTVNSIAGGGSLLTFPTLIGLGYSPLVSNVTNTLGVAPGTLTGVYGYRRQLGGQGREIRRLAVVCTLGALGGGELLLHTPAGAFRVIVVVLIAIASLLVLAQPTLLRLWTSRSSHRRPKPVAAALTVFAVAVYGGYFGAGIGVLLIGALGLLHPDTLLRTNALKTALTLVINGVAALLFCIAAPIAWDAAATLAVASGAGGIAGARISRVLPEPLMRGVIVVIGLGAAAYVALRA
jgi:uncharacterized membrane protein YfcA